MQEENYAQVILVAVLTFIIVCSQENELINIICGLYAFLYIYKNMNVNNLHMVVLNAAISISFIQPILGLLFKCLNASVYNGYHTYVGLEAVVLTYLFKVLFVMLLYTIIRLITKTFLY